MRHTLETIQQAQIRRGINQRVIRGGGVVLPRQAQGAQEEKLYSGGTATFILGQHSLDDSEVRWIP